MKSLILHIPHSSLKIPDYSNYILPENEVDIEAIRMSDLYTDELFQDTLQQKRDHTFFTLNAVNAMSAK